MSLLNSVKACALYTGTNGRRKCTSKCIGCFLGEFELNHPIYQGNIEQVHELLSVLPNLERVAIVGNPDPSVDPEFCNEAARILQNKGVKIMFCTSGIGGIEVARKLVDGLDPSLVFRFAFSIHSLDEEKDSIMKGVKISHQSVFESMKYIQNLGINVSALFSLWPINEDDDWVAYKEFFESRGIYTSGRFGNVEGARGRIKAISEEKILEIREKNKDVRLGVILANDEEYADYLSLYASKNELRCTHCERINVYLTEDGVKVSSFCPMLANVQSELTVNIRDLKLPTFGDDVLKKGYCPISEQALGFKRSENLHPVCRFYKIPLEKTIPDKSLRWF